MIEIAVIVIVTLYAIVVIRRQNKTIDNLKSQLITETKKAATQGWSKGFEIGYERAKSIYDYRASSSLNNLD